ncbi:MAG: tRNA lysidine(34) synthetase TilS [Firmicutes bacterium]|nr:tRNA lysidine(34) synthetase TilS [Bacillota bacterium]
MREKFENIIKAYTPPDDVLAVAVSGGADSMCLLSLCLTSPQIKKENLIVISVDHKIRGENSARDLAFVRDFCALHGVKFLPFSVDVPKLAKEKGISLETAGREARVRIFYSLVFEGRADKVLTAHHASDNAESILMHIFRGCGLNGLCGMEYCREDFLLRPLLDVVKDEIDAYVVAHDIPYVTDETNADSAYARNFIRNEVLPLIKQKYPGVERAVNRLGEQATALFRWTDGVCGAEIHYEYAEQTDPKNDNPVAAKIRVEAFGEEVESAWCVIEALKKLGAYSDIQQKHVYNIRELAKAENGSMIDLPGNFRAIKEYDFVALYRTDGSSVSTAEMKFKTGRTQMENAVIEIKKCKKIPKKEDVPFGTLYFDLKKIPADAVFRHRRAGDVFCPYGGGTRKLKEFFIDEKIPLRFRDWIRCIASGNEILAVAQYEISDKIKVEEGSDVYSITVR